MIATAGDLDVVIVKHSLLGILNAVFLINHRVEFGSGRNPRTPLLRHVLCDTVASYLDDNSPEENKALRSASPGSITA